MIWKDQIYAILEAKIFNVAAKLKALAHIPSEAHDEGLYNVYLNHFQGFRELWLLPDEIYGDI